MRTLSRDQFLQVFELTSGAFDALQRAGHVALAFGTPSRQRQAAISIWTSSPWQSPPGSRRHWSANRYDDCVGLLYTSGSQSVGHADADWRKTIFCDRCVGWDNDERRPRQDLGDERHIEQITSDLRNASSVMAVNISDIVAPAYQGAHGRIDLSQPFFFPAET